MALEEHAPGSDDEVVTTVPDEDAARPVVESLLLAGVGPSLREVADGVAVCVVAGEGERARRVLGLDAPVDPSAVLGALAVSPSAAGSAARRSAAGAAAPADVPAGWSTMRIIALFVLALMVIPVIAFYVSFRVAGG